MKHGAACHHRRRPCGPGRRRWPPGKPGVEDILIIERDRELGGILNQCIHSGLRPAHLQPRSSPARSTPGGLLEQVRELNIPCLLDTMVLDLSAGRGC